MGALMSISMKIKFYLEMGAPPETILLILPPKASLTLLKTAMS
jgi:hypothetical protein